jgi:hypothetical protein
MKIFRLLSLRFLILAWGSVMAGGSVGAGAQAALPDVVKPPPSINLGSTSFYDGFGRVKAGVTVLEYFRWSHGTEIADANGGENAKFIAPRIDSFPSLTQLIVASKWHPLGGTAGFSILVPLVEVRASFAADSPKTLSVHGFSLGDIIAGPTFQSRPFLHRPALEGYARTAQGLIPPPRTGPYPYLSYRVQFLVQAPSGGFDRATSINPGSGYWAVIPYLAVTSIPRPRFEMSTRLHYQYNLPTTKIANPPPIPHLVYLNGQAGQLVYGNFTGSYRFTGKLYVGANSYGVYQLSPDKTNGVSVGKARETQFYLGPGGGYDFSNSDTLNVNLYLKLETHNAVSGPSLQMLYIHRF